MSMRSMALDKLRDKLSGDGAAKSEKRKSSKRDGIEDLTENQGPDDRAEVSKAIKEGQKTDPKKGEKQVEEAKKSFSSPGQDDPAEVEAGESAFPKEVLNTLPVDKEMVRKKMAKSTPMGKARKEMGMVKPPRR